MWPPDAVPGPAVSLRQPAVTFLRQLGELVHGCGDDVSLGVEAMGFVVGDLHAHGDFGAGAGWPQPPVETQVGYEAGDRHRAALLAGRQRLGHREVGVSGGEHDVIAGLRTGVDRSDACPPFGETRWIVKQLPYFFG